MLGRSEVRHCCRFGFLEASSCWPWSLQNLTVAGRCFGVHVAQSPNLRREKPGKAECFWVLRDVGDVEFGLLVDTRVGRNVGIFGSQSRAAVEQAMIHLLASPDGRGFGGGAACLCHSGCSDRCTRCNAQA